MGALDTKDTYLDSDLCSVSGKFVLANSRDHIVDPAVARATREGDTNNHVLVKVLELIPMRLVLFAATDEVSYVTVSEMGECVVQKTLGLVPRV